MPTLVILDGNSLLYRGFFAMRYLSTSDGLPTNAVYSFVNMLFTIVEREKPNLIFAAFDPPGPTFRHVDFESYKATRQAMPDELAPQRAPAREASLAFNVPVVEVEGFEADDVCGTLAEMGKKLGYDVLIVTGDGDALQLVDDGDRALGRGAVKVMITVKGVSDTVTYDEAAVRARYGLGPSQIPDMKALKGDSSDNLPGVPGIGEKGAAKLLQQFETVENLLQNTAGLPEKTRATLEANAEIARQCKRLATIVRDVPLPDWVTLSGDYQKAGPNVPVLRAFFERMEFRTLARRLQAEPVVDSRIPSGSPLAKPVEVVAVTGTLDLDGLDTPPPSGSRKSVRDSVDCVTVTDETHLAALLAAAAADAGPVGLHLHIGPPRAALMEAHVLGVALAFAKRAYYVRWDRWRDRIAPLLEDSRIAKSIYDLKYAAGVLLRNGVSLRGVQFDPLLAAYLLNAGRSSYPLDDIAVDLADLSLTPENAQPEARAVDEALASRLLAAPARAKLEQDGLAPVFENIEVPLSIVIAQLEITGVTVDSARLREVSVWLAAEITRLEREIHALADQEFSIGSVKQLQEVLFEKLKLPAIRKTKTGYSTGAEILEELSSQGHEIAGKVLQWREVSKLKSTYADSLPLLVNPGTGKIHTTLSQTVASTGRLSSSNPNLQNIPIRREAGREIRKAFVAGPNRVLVSADYSQIELRLFAHITQDPGLLAAFRSGEDIHAQTARRVFQIPPGDPVTGDQRRQAKTINFAVLYGASAFRVANELGTDQATAAALIKAYFALYPGVNMYVAEVVQGARENGYVQTLLGRRRYVPDVRSRVYQFRQAAEREAANMPVQGTAADIIKLAMLAVDKALTEAKMGSKMVLQVHDELLFEAPADEVSRLVPIVRSCMESAYPLEIPLEVEVKCGQNWWDVTPVTDDDAEARFLTEKIYAHD